MGGGSADGAAVLLALNCLYGENLSEELLQTLSLAIGTDVPFCRLKRTAICTGDGSRVRFVRDNIPWENYRLVLVKPDAGISTAESYRTFDEITGGTDTLAPGAEKALAALADGDMEALGGAIYNSLMIPAGKLCPAVAEIAEYLREAGAVMAQMTGSGTCVFAFFDRQSGTDIGAVLDGARQRFGSGAFVYAEG